MADKILITMDDLETAVPVNAAFEEARDATVLVSSMDDSYSVLRQSAPDIVVLTGSLHERPTTELIQHARDRSISTLGLVEATEPDPRRVARECGLTDWIRKPAEPQEIILPTGLIVRQSSGGPLQLAQNVPVHGSARISRKKK